MQLFSSFQSDFWTVRKPYLKAENKHDSSWSTTRPIRGKIPFVKSEIIWIPTEANTFLCHLNCLKCNSDCRGEKGEEFYTHWVYAMSMSFQWSFNSCKSSTKWFEILFKCKGRVVRVKKYLPSSFPQAIEYFQRPCPPSYISWSALFTSLSSQKKVFFPSWNG